MVKLLSQLVVVATVTAATYNASACCAAPEWFYDTLRCTVGDRQSIIVTAKPTQYVTSKPFTDTLYFTDFSVRLKAAYDTSDLVFIAKVTRAVPFMPAISALDQEVFQSESVTITLETMLKGNPLPSTWNFISQDFSCSQRWLLDSLTGETRTVTMESSLSEPRFASVLNDRYLFFIKENNFITGEHGTFQKMLPNVCDPFSSSYKINLNNEIYYDGFEYDTLRKSISNIPDISCPLGTFTRAIQSSSIIDRLHTGSNNGVGTPGATYNLLGKRITGIFRQTHLQSRSTPGLYIYTGSAKDASRPASVFNSTRQQRCVKAD